MDVYSVYVKKNQDGYIIAINSSEFLEDPVGWMKIDEGKGDRYHHAQGNYFPAPIRTALGAYRYKMVEGKSVECSQEEISQQEENLKQTVGPTWQDTMEAQIMYTALMTDTLLE